MEALKRTSPLLHTWLCKRQKIRVGPSLIYDSVIAQSACRACSFRITLSECVPGMG